MSNTTKCQRCGYEKKSDYSYEPCPVCKGPMMFNRFFLETVKKDKNQNL